MAKKRKVKKAFLKRNLGNRGNQRFPMPRKSEDFRGKRTARVIKEKKRKATRTAKLKIKKSAGKIRISQPIKSQKPKISDTKRLAMQVEREVQRMRAKAFTKPRKRRGWFAERREHALVAKGIDVRKKELAKYKLTYLIFLLISLLLAILSLFNHNSLSFGIAIVIMLFTVICYRNTTEKTQRKSIIYIVTWPLTFSLAVASIFKRNFISFSLAVLAMSLSSLASMLISKKARKEEIIKTIRELQKSRKSVETDFDKLLVLLGRFGRLKMSEIAEAFEIDRKKADEWAAILEENNLAVLHYPAFGEEELKRKLS